MLPFRPSQPRGPGWLCLAAYLTGCASLAQPPPAQPEPAPAEVRSVGGGGTVVIQRPTPKWARLSLWVSAGARDARPPALATVAARWAAERAGAQARVLPDATEISLDCDLETQRLARCVAALATALSARSPEPAQVATLVRQMRRQGGRPATAHLDLEALAALLGEAPAASLDPLAMASDAPMDAAAVDAFLRDHYGADRALLVAAGDVQAEALSGWSTGLPQARRERSGPTLKASDGGVRLVDGTRPGLVLALAAPSIDEASSLGRAFALPHPGATASAFAVDGQALLLLRVPVVGAPWTELRTAAFDALRLSLEGSPDAPPEPLPQDLTSLCRRSGEAWVQGRPREDTLPRPWPLAAAIALPSLSPVAPSEESELESRRRDGMQQARAAMEAARSQLEPGSKGRADDARAELTLANGVTLEVQRRAGDAAFAASVEVRGGASLDGRDLHGRAAHLATLSASACAFASRPALARDLQQEGTRLRPMVTGDHWGVLTQGPAEYWQRGVDRLLRCVVRPSFRARDVEDARVALLSELGRNPGAEYAWAAARTLLPDSPGALAPWGNPTSLAAIDAGALRRLHAQTLRGGGVVVRLRTPAPADEVAAFVARRLAQLPSGRASLPDPPRPPGPRPLEGVKRDDQAAVHAWVGLAGPRLDSDAAVVALAEQVGYRLSALPGYALRGLAGGGRPFGWFWLELVVSDPAQLDALPGAVDAAMRATRRSLPEAIAASLTRTRRVRRAAGSDPGQELRELFFARAQDPVSTRELRTLLEAEPIFVLSHPTAP